MKTPKNKKTKVSQPYQLLVYVEDCNQKIKKFKTTEEMGAYIDTFVKNNPNWATDFGDDWLDYCITNVSGDVHFFTDGIKVD